MTPEQVREDMRRVGGRTLLEWQALIVDGAFAAPKTSALTGRQVAWALVLAAFHVPIGGGTGAE